MAADTAKTAAGAPTVAAAAVGTLGPPGKHLLDEGEASGSENAGGLPCTRGQWVAGWGGGHGSRFPPTISLENLERSLNDFLNPKLLQQRRRYLFHKLHHS